MRHKRRVNDKAEESRFTPSAPEVVASKAIPFAERLTCTISEACEVTGLGSTKLNELIGDGHLAATTVGRGAGLTSSEGKGLFPVYQMSQSTCSSRRTKRSL